MNVCQRTNFAWFTTHPSHYSNHIRNPRRPSNQCAIWAYRNHRAQKFTHQGRKHNTWCFAGLATVQTFQLLGSKLLLCLQGCEDIQVTNPTQYNDIRTYLIRTDKNEIHRNVVGHRECNLEKPKEHILVKWSRFVMLTYLPNHFGTHIQCQGGTRGRLSIQNAWQKFLGRKGSAYKGHPGSKPTHTFSKKLNQCLFYLLVRIKYAYVGITGMNEDRHVELGQFAQSRMWCG